MRSRVLILDDDLLLREWYKRHLHEKHQIRICANVHEFREKLKSFYANVVILDVDIENFGSALELIPEVKSEQPDAAILISSGRTDFPTLRRALQLGAQDYIAKQHSPDELLHAIDRLLKTEELAQEVASHRIEDRRKHERTSLLGESPKMIELKKKIEKLQKVPSNVLIFGETGSGKERVARQLRKKRSDGSVTPFISVDSATIQSSMAEGILFGYKKGAFTGADQDTPGLFEAANGGIIFFDEISNMPLEIQTKLLRVLQEKEVLRLGTTQTIPLEFRVVAATNQRLEKLVAEGRFKDDLYQRLNVLPVEVPSLKERLADIPILAQNFCTEHASKMDRALKLSDETLEMLKSYPWPGNVRELQNVIAYIVAFSDTDLLEPSDLPPQFRELTLRNKESSSSSSEISFYDQVAQFEKSILDENYLLYQKNISKMALALGMDRSHLYSKLKTYKINEKV